MLKYKSMNKNLQEATMSDKYSKRVEQKLNQKMNLINSNLKIMDSLKLNDHEDEENTNFIKSIGSGSKYDELKVDHWEEPDEKNEINYETALYDKNDDCNTIKSNDYIQMAMYYKNLCRTYKKQLNDSHKTIRELHTTIEHLERKNWIQKRQKSSMQLLKLETETNMKETLNKCGAYCEKINRLGDSIREYSDNQAKEELIYNTLKNTLKEKKEFKIFSKTFYNLISYINQDLTESWKDEPINITNLNEISNEALKYLYQNNMKNFHCKCNHNSEFGYSSSAFSDCIPDTKKHNELAVYHGSDSASSSSSITNIHENLDNKKSFIRRKSSSHRPTTEFLVNVLHIIQDLFDVDCFLSIPTKLNEVYYKMGQLSNFKNAIQNVFAPGQNYTIEKLINAVQVTHNQLNQTISTNLKTIFHSSNLHGVIDKFNMYDEYFPLFRELLDQIMKNLEISRLDQIIPSIRALKILSTPTSTK